MLTKHKPKGLRQAKFLGALPRCAVGLGHVQHLAFNTCVGFALCAVTLTQADTIYRCGEAYSASSQCGNSVASEVKPTSALHSTGPNKNDTSSSDLRDAQTLEKQRLQLERQATSSAPIRLNTPALAPVSATSTEPIVPHAKRRGPYGRKLQSPYFTAVEPSAAPKKKSTAKAVPEKSNAQP